MGKVHAGMSLLRAGRCENCVWDGVPLAVSTCSDCTHRPGMDPVWNMGILPLQHSLLVLSAVPDPRSNLGLGPLKEPPTNIRQIPLPLSIRPLPSLLLSILSLLPSSRCRCRCESESQW